MEDTRRIPLTQGRFAVVDAADYDALSRFKWHCSMGYAYRRVTEQGRSRGIAMHRIIAQAPEGSDVDHINGDTLDNRRANLRLCSRAENTRNRKKHGGEPTSRFKGVYRQATGWVASVRKNGRRVHLGFYDREEDAARAYDAAARDAYGEFARLNFPGEEPVRLETLPRKVRGAFGSSSARGVSWHKRIGKWQARTTVNGERTNLGYFTTEAAAAEACATARDR